MVIRRALGATSCPTRGIISTATRFTNASRPPGPDHAQVAACAGMADYIDALADHHGVTGTAAERATGVHDLMRAHEVRLLQPLLDHLGAKNSVRVLGPRDADGPRADRGDRDPARRAQIWPRSWRLSASWRGAATSTPGGPLQAMGVDLEKGVLRLSFVHYTDQAEMDRLITALDEVL